MGITAGPDGNVWFTAQAPLTPDQVGRITPAGAITSFPLSTGSTSFFLVGGPWGITTGPDGNLWSIRSGIENKVGPNFSFIDRTTPAGVVTEFSVQSNLTGANITAGPDGNLWFTATGNVGRITPSGVVTLFPTTSGGQAGDITAGPDGNLWFTDIGNDSIGRITPTGSIMEFALPAVGQEAGATGITTGPDGNLWFTRRNIILLDQQVDQIGRITPAGAITLFALPTPGSGPQSITAGSDGALWFTETGGNKIGRITTAGVITEVALAMNRFPGDIRTGPDGNLWFTEADGKLGQLVIAPNPTPNQLFVMQLYRDLLGREAESAGLAFWTGLMDRGFTRLQIVQGIQGSPEHESLVVQQLYGQLLHRAPEPAGLANWVSFLAHGGTAEQVEAGILASPEYFQLHGGTIQGFVAALYQDVLQRSPDAAGAQAWTGFLSLGVPRSVVAAGFLTSLESDTLEVQDWYARYLHRPADPAGLQLLTDLQHRGVSREQEIALILASDEYFARLS